MLDPTKDTARRLLELAMGGTGCDSEFAGARVRGLNFKPLRRTLASKAVSDSAKNALKRAFTDGIVAAQKGEDGLHDRPSVPAVHGS